MAGKVNIFSSKQFGHYSLPVDLSDAE